MASVYELCGNGYTVNDIVKFMKSSLGAMCTLRGTWRNSTATLNNDVPIIIEVFNLALTLHITIIEQDSMHVIETLGVPKHVLAMFLIDGESVVHGGFQISKSLTGIKITELRD